MVVDVISDIVDGGGVLCWHCDVVLNWEVVQLCHIFVAFIIDNSDTSAVIECI